MLNLPVDVSGVPVAEVGGRQVAGARHLQLEPRVALDGLVLLVEGHVTRQRHPHEPVRHHLPVMTTA